MATTEQATTSMKGDASLADSTNSRSHRLTVIFSFLAIYVIWGSTYVDSVRGGGDSAVVHGRFETPLCRIDPAGVVRGKTLETHRSTIARKRRDRSAVFSGRARITALGGDSSAIGI